MNLITCLFENTITNFEFKIHEVKDTLRFSPNKLLMINFLLIVQWRASLLIKRWPNKAMQTVLGSRVY